MKIRIGISPCPNDVFIYAGLILGKVASPGWDFAFDFQDLETLNQAAQKGEYDAVKISYANLPRCAENYRLLRCGGALGRGCGPLLLTGGESFDVQGVIALPGEATTAHALLKVYAEHQWPGRELRKTFLPFDVIYGKLREDPRSQGVVIHEMRFTYANDGLVLVKDLGEHWEKFTRSPIPLGALVLRRNLAVNSSDFEDCVRRSLAWAHAHSDQALMLCRRHAQSMQDHVLRSHIGLYVNAFSADLGAEGEDAVARFLRHMRYEGGIPF